MIFIPNIVIKNDGDRLTLKPEIEFRGRYERRTDTDFNGAANDNKSILYSRYRPGVSWKYGKEWSGLLQYQYAHQLTWSQAGNSSLENSDVFQAFAVRKVGDTKLTIGRQKLNFGTNRLIGSPDWSHTGRSYDAVRYQTKKLDVFGARIGVAAGRPNFARVFGVGVDNNLGTTSLIYKHDVTSTGDVDHYTLDQTYNHDFGFAKLEAEGALQSGRASGKNQEAWAVHLQLSKNVGKKFTEYIEVNSASGGSNATTTRTFDNLYAANHLIYGLMDIQGWKNMNQISVGAKYDLKKDTCVSFRASSNDLRDPSDGWYGIGGSINKSGSTSLRDATGQSGRHVGEEYDLEMTFKTKTKGTFSGGLAMFTPGTFVKTMVGSSHNQYWGYLQYTVKF